MHLRNMTVDFLTIATLAQFSVVTDRSCLCRPDKFIRRFYLQVDSNYWRAATFRLWNVVEVCIHPSMWVASDRITRSEDRTRSRFMMTGSTSAGLNGDLVLFMRMSYENDDFQGFGQTLTLLTAAEKSVVRLTADASRISNATSRSHPRTRKVSATKMFTIDIQVAEKTLDALTEAMSSRWMYFAYW